MKTRVDIIQNALVLMGLKPDANIIDSSEAESTANQAYDLIYPQIISINNWRFSIKLQRLNQLDEIFELKDWKYVFALPNDYLGLIGIHPNTNYSIYGKNIVANVKDITLEYKFLPDIEDAPAYFDEYFVLELAAHLGQSMAENSNLAAFFANKALMLKAEAIYQDNQSVPSPEILDDPFISVRF